MATGMESPITAMVRQSRKKKQDRHGKKSAAQKRPGEVTKGAFNISGLVKDTKEVKFLLPFNFCGNSFQFSAHLAGYGYGIGIAFFLNYQADGRFPVDPVERGSSGQRCFYGAD